MASDDSKSTKKDLTSILELPRLDATEFSVSEEISDGLNLAEPLPTGDETGHGEEPHEFHTSTDAAVFGLGGEDVLESLPPIDPEIEELAASGTATNDGTNDGALTAGPAENTMAAIKNYSETHSAESAQPATALTPYSLLIEGPLKTHEREKLVAILNREKLGVREMDLEPQFASNRVLIPRISEYAGVILLQALRNSGAKLRLGPSDRIFLRSNEFEATDKQGPMQFFDDRDQRMIEMPMTTDQTFAEAQSIQVIDTLHATFLIQASLVVSSRSAAIEEGIEKLKRQMKLQAHFRGANGIVSFKTELHQNPERSHYTVIAQGVAVKMT